MSFPDHSLTLSVDQRIERISTTIRTEEQRLRAKYPLLNYQNAIGLLIMLVSLAGMIASAWLYYSEIIPAWLCIVCAAIFASISHELEHDLIHRQYYRKNAVMQNMMLLVVWVMRPNTISPWYRRKMHFLHHKVSGTEQDLEERLVGNGLHYGWHRFLVMFDSFLGTLSQRAVLSAKVNTYSTKELLIAAFPFALFHFACWYLFLFLHGYDAIVGGALLRTELLVDMTGVINFLVVVLIAPNILRSASLNFVTSSMHYYGGVTHLIQQTQILKPWFFAPLHLFCFNFGSTHSIHHFVIGQPFYIRQLLAKVAHKVMIENGVRFNDFGAFNRANAYRDA